MKILFITIAACTIAAALNVSAKTVKYPEKDPAFSFELPDDWTTSVDKSGNLDCTAGDGSQFSFSVLATKGMPDMGTDAEVKAYLPKLAKTMGEGAQIADMKAQDVHEMTNPHKVKLMGMNATGKSGAADMVISLASFAPEEGDYFILMGASSVEVDKAHDNAMTDVINSIKPIDDGDDD